MSVQRPVIPGFHPDPSICRVGGTYYLATSSFEYAPGVPIFRSADLRSWELIGHALHRPSQLDLAAARSSDGVLAPTLRYHGGRFWMITTNLADKGGQLLVWAEDPAGPWSDPVRIPGALGIDPDLAWDEDGTCYMSYAGFGPNGGEGIVQSVIDPLTGELLTERLRIWSGTGGKFPEGPHLYHIEDQWYLLIAEGGTERGHAVTIARGPSPSGPFESCPHNPILTHRGTDLSVQNTGHADMVQRPDGTWAMVYHGVRTRGSSPEWHVLGRETFADEIVWKEGWPVPVRHLEPAADAETLAYEELIGSDMPYSWVASHRFLDGVVSREEGSLRVTTIDGESTFVGRRQEHLYARIRTRVSVNGSGGLSLRIDPRHAVELECSDGTARAVWAVGDIRHVLGERGIGDEAELELSILPAEGNSFSTELGPDRIVLAVHEGDSCAVLGEVDGRYVSTEVAGGMTGRMVGISCHRGSVLIRSFEYLGADSPATVVSASTLSCMP